MTTTGIWISYAASGMIDGQSVPAKAGTSAMWRNNGNGTFTNVDIGLSDLQADGS